MPTAVTAGGAKTMMFRRIHSVSVSAVLLFLASNMIRIFMRIDRWKPRLTMVSLGIVAAVWLGGRPAAQSLDTVPLALTHVTVIDGTGAPPKPNQTVIVAGDRITAVGGFDAVRIPPTARTIDATGRFLIPGLFESHIHTRYEGIDHLRLLIANGITSARNMSGPWDHLAQIHSWREQIRKGERVGPRLLTAGPILDGPGTGRPGVQVVVSNAEEAREAVRRIKREGADFVKVYTLLSRESYFAIAAEAREQGLPFAGHVPLSVKTDEAAAAGQRTLEHEGGIPIASSTREEELRRQLAEFRPPTPGQRTAPPLSAAVLRQAFNSQKLSALAERLRANQTAVVPTLSVLGNGSEGPDAIPPDRLRYIPAVYIDALKQLGPRETAEERRARIDLNWRIVQGLDAAGVTILAGTDGIMAFQITGFSLHDELALLVKAGLPAMRALQAATRNPARVFNLPDQGTIEQGKRADLVLLDANPLANIENAKKIRAVVAAGRLFDRNDLDSMLADIRNRAREWTGTPTR
jgi:cytosine/adenosine deaminase-related metal-dependent hydrolase